ncbi:MAG: zf-HC2 domain-containing protein [Butyribacter sp.]|nr:zf-HC2 domain-containing protein [bacterium]MDY3853373.1 zf-HC2 domain-containing protein [Butyribacter sp.]
MECREVQKKYIPFIDDMLSVKDLEAFLAHMDACPDCREEYDVYYTMIMGVRYLDDNIKSTDWVSSDRKLEYARQYLHKYRIRKLEKFILFAAMCIGIVLFI